jgi:hypothetical protein
MGNHNNNKKEENEDKNKEIPLQNINNNQINNHTENLTQENNINENIQRRRKHTLFRLDNIIKRINSCFFRFMIDFLNKHLIKKNFHFKLLNYRNLYCTMKEIERLWKMKISDIIYEKEISLKYLDKNHNKNIIDKIYKEKEEIYAIRILELTFEELFIIFRRKLNDTEDMKKLEEIKDKIEGIDLLEMNNEYEDIKYYLDEFSGCGSQEYIEDFKRVCLEYEKFFKKR